MPKTDIGTPLTPDLLKDLGALDAFPPAAASFAPDGNFKNLYRICTCDGYRGSSSTITDVGFLRVECLGRSPDGTFTLGIEQQTVHRENAVNRIKAEAQCNNDPSASLVRWRVSSWLITPEGEVQADLNVEEDCQVAGERIEATSNGRTYTRKGASSLTSDWCLLEAVQRLPFNDQPALVFNMLEGLSLLRRGHELRYRGVETLIPLAGKRVHRFYQLGEGTAPYEYWVDEQHRVVLAVTQNRAYILDDKAEEKFAAAVEAGRADFAKRKKSELKDLKELQALRRAHEQSTSK